VNVKCAVMVPW